MPSAVMLFAAGFGTRMGALTAKQPKPLIKVAGRPLIDHALTLTEGVETRVVNTHYRADQIHAYLARRRDIQVSHETPDLLDTGGGLRHALPLLGRDPVFTLNTDAVWTGRNPLDTLRSAWDPTRMEGLLLLVSIEHAVGHTGSGDFTMSPKGTLRRGPGSVYTGAQILRTESLADIPAPAFSLNRVWDIMLQRGTLFGVLHRGGWCDVGRPEGIAQAEALLERSQCGPTF